MLGRRSWRAGAASSDDRAPPLGRPGRRRAAPRCAPGALHRSHDGGGGRGGRCRAQPHVVRQLRRSPRPAPLRSPTRRDGAQPRAAAPVEVGAARRRIRALELLRAHGSRGRGRDHRRLGGDETRHHRFVSEHRSRADRGDPQRHRRRRVPARPRHRRARAIRHRPGRAIRRVRWPHHASEGRPLLAPGGAGRRSGGAARPLCRCAGHAGARGRGRRTRSTGCAPRAAM